MIINALRWQQGRSASRISGLMLAAAATAVLPLALAGAPAGAAVRDLPGQAAATPA